MWFAHVFAIKKKFMTLEALLQDDPINPAGQRGPFDITPALIGLDFF